MTTQDSTPPTGLARAVRAITRKGVALVAQATAGGIAVVCVGGLAGLWWAGLTLAGVLAVAGVLAEL